jgi:ABC-type transport system involved in cytochrome c biogenesis permease subunit
VLKNIVSFLPKIAKQFVPLWMQFKRTLSFGLLIAMIVALAGATIIELFYGTDTARRLVYVAPWAIAAWGVIAAFGLALIWSRRRAMRPATVLLHLAWVVILAGALISHLTALHGTIHLRLTQPATAEFALDDGMRARLPFDVKLRAFAIDYYPATRTPMDYVSTLSIGADSAATATVSMNNVLSRSGYRLYQSSYDEDLGGVTLQVASDPWGIGVTYCGYLLLALAMLGHLPLRRLLRPRVAAAALILAAAAPAAMAQRTIAPAVADSLGEVYINYNGRICPLSTFARDFTRKITGADSYHGLSATQVLAGWLFYYDEWKRQPMILIKEADARRALAIAGKRARLTDFVGPEGYRLDESHRYANEKFSLITTVANGEALRIYPTDSCRWYSAADRIPASEVTAEQLLFITKSLNLAAQYIYEGDDAAAAHLFAQMRRYQERTLGVENLPSPAAQRAERWLNRMPSAKVPAMACLALGLLAYVAAVVAPRRRGFMPAALTVAALMWAYLSVAIGLRWIVGGHAPLSNGFEVMQFMAWAALGATLVIGHRRGLWVVAGGLLVAGFAMLVSGIGESNPAITPLMPVLVSPLLSVHVMLVMLSYALLALLAIGGLTALLRPSMSAELHRSGRAMLTPALFLLAAGIFLGAVWANQSWGTYWSWDPKETWALITMLIYSLPLHSASLPALRSARAFHIYMLAALASVAVTYFGVNFLLGGMHSYA